MPSTVQKNFRYELYGVINIAGTMTYIEYYTSLPAALEGVKARMDEHVHYVFLIVKRQLKNSPISMSYIGWTWDGVYTQEFNHETGRSVETGKLVVTTDGTDYTKNPIDAVTSKSVFIDYFEDVPC